MANTRHINYTMRLDSGLIIPAAAGTGKILTSDAEGNMTLQAPAKKKFIMGHTWVVSGAVTELLLPGFFVKVGEGNAKKLVAAEYITSKGEAEFEVRKNAELATGFGALVAKTTAGRVAPTAVALATEDYIRIKIIKLTSAPENLSVTVFVEVEA